MSRTKYSHSWKNPVNHSPERMKRAALLSIEGKTPNEIAAIIKGTGRAGLKQQTTWIELKKRVYAVYGYRCMKCGTLPKYKQHSNVDHIKPRKYYPELALEFDNMQVLCGRCNKEKGNGSAVDYRNMVQDASGEFSDHNVSQFLMQF